ncbi:MAG: DUF4179 domain-containing protein [Chloroflexota bacterium]|nr:DUF4179 domain-containing protein [Chloroflexota bacterium]
MPKQDIKQDYSDILDGPEDAHLAHLVQDLNSIYTAPERPAYLTWARVRGMQAQKSQGQGRILTLPRARRRRWQWSIQAIAVAILAVSLIAGTAYAAVKVISPMLSPALTKSINGFNAEPNFAPSDRLQARDFTLIGQTKTLAGVTVKLEAAYADINRVFLGCMVESKDAKKIATLPGKGGLNTRQGLLLPQSESGGSDENTLNFPLVATFDANVITGEPKQLDLHLTMLVGTMVQPPREKPQLQVLGTLAFDFSVPFHLGKVLTPGLSATVRGQKVTLEKIVMALSGTRIYIGGLKDIEKRTQQGIKLFVPNVKDYVHAHEWSPTSNGTWAFDYPQVLTHKDGKWTIVVWEADPNVTSLSQIRTWTFHLNVPA